MIAAAPIRFGLDPLAWQIYPRIELGPLAISPHGIGIALGFLLGAQLMVRRARRFGGPPEPDIWNALFWALLGAIVGARVGYVIGHFAQVTDNGDDLLGVLKIWEGGISLIGGIAGAVLAALPYLRRKRMGFWRTLDLAAPGLALGIVVGRIGDLVIGDHLGKPTDFALGWLCLGEGGGPPLPADAYLEAFAAGNPPSLGCFDLILHQTALYDLASTLVLLVVLLLLGRKPRSAGLMILSFTVWYAAMRVITDFLRVDQRYFGLTGSQIVAVCAGVISLFLIARYRGAPPRFAAPPAPREGVPRPPTADTAEGSEPPETPLADRSAPSSEERTSISDTERDERGP